LVIELLEVRVIAAPSINLASTSVVAAVGSQATIAIESSEAIRQLPLSESYQRRSNY